MFARVTQLEIDVMRTSVEEAAGRFDARPVCVCAPGFRRHVVVYSGRHRPSIIGESGRTIVLDFVIRGGQVVLPAGPGAWDIGIEGERIVAIALPGTLPTESARVIDASGKIVTPGGVEPHAHLAHGIMSHPEAPAMTLGPRSRISPVSPAGRSLSPSTMRISKPGRARPPVVAMVSGSSSGDVALAVPASVSP